MQVTTTTTTLRIRRIGNLGNIPTFEPFHEVAARVGLCVGERNDDASYQSFLADARRYEVTLRGRF
jgi:hypothetical protein